MNIGAVLLHYRFWPEVKPALDALLAQTMRPSTVVVVDNLSSDGSPARIRQHYPSVDVLEMTSNLGYAGGMNQGIRHLLPHGCDALLLLTHECVLREEALASLVSRLETDPRLGAVGPLLCRLSNREEVWSAGGTIDRSRWSPRHIAHPPSREQWAGRPPHEVEWLDGSCLLLRRGAVETTGLLDERYFLYYEDSEYLLRMRRTGWRTECVPAAVAYQEPSPIPTYLDVRNRLHFVAATGSRPVLARETARESFRIVRSLARGSDREEVKARLRGLLTFLRTGWHQSG